MRIVAINTLKLKGELAKIQKGVEQGLDDAANEAKNRLLRPTEDWDNPPSFEIERQPGKRAVFTRHNHYVWVNNGTNRRGRRTVARGRALHLPSKWGPKTVPMDLNSHGGERVYVEGENLFRSVPMSSIEGRHWDTLVADQFEAGLLKLMVQRAINRL